MKILAMGDSLTLGEIGYGYVEYLNPRHSVINRGINGDTTEGVSERLINFTLEEKTDDIDVLILFVGINDVLFFDYTFTDELFEKTYVSMAKHAAGFFKNIILVSMPYVEFRFINRDRIILRNEIIRKTAEKNGFSFVDLYSVQEKHKDRPLTIDGAHFTRFSAQLLAERIEKCLDEFEVNS